MRITPRLASTAARGPRTVRASRARSGPTQGVLGRRGSVELISHNLSRAISGTGVQQSAAHGSARGRSTDELLVFYVLERFLHRLSCSPYADRLVLKDGTLLAVLDARRSTRCGLIGTAARPRRAACRSVGARDRAHLMSTIVSWYRGEESQRCRDHGSGRIRGRLSYRPGLRCAREHDQPEAVHDSGGQLRERCAVHMAADQIGMDQVVGWCSLDRIPRAMSRAVSAASVLGTCSVTPRYPS